MSDRSGANSLVEFTEACRLKLKSWQPRHPLCSHLVQTGCLEVCAVLMAASAAKTLRPLCEGEPAMSAAGKQGDAKVAPYFLCHSDQKSSLLFLLDREEGTKQTLKHKSFVNPHP